MRKKRMWMFALLIILFLVIALFFIRLINPRELDDVTSGIPCEQNLIEKANTLWVIPDFNNTDISENISWCSYILSLNKTVGMHGVFHGYNEFRTDRNQEYLDK